MYALIQAFFERQHVLIPNSNFLGQNIDQYSTSLIFLNPYQEYRTSHQINYLFMLAKINFHFQCSIYLYVI